MLVQKSKDVDAEMFTTTISLSQELHRKLKHLAVDQGVSVRDLIRQAIEQYLGGSETVKSSDTNSDLE